MTTQNTSQQVSHREERTFTEFLFTTVIVILQLLIVLQTISDVTFLPAVTEEELLSTSMISIGVLVGNQLRHMNWPTTVSDTVNVRGVTALILGSSISVHILIVTTNITNTVNMTPVSAASIGIVLGITLINMSEGATKLQQSMRELRSHVNE